MVLIMAQNYLNIFQTIFYRVSGFGKKKITCSNAALAAMAELRLAEHADTSIAGLLHCDINSRRELRQYILVKIDSILSSSL